MEIKKKEKSVNKSKEELGNGIGISLLLRSFKLQSILSQIKVVWGRKLKAKGGYWGGGGKPNRHLTIYTIYTPMLKANFGINQYTLSSEATATSKSCIV